MKAHAAQHTGARRRFRYSGSIQALFRLYEVSLKGASNTQVFVAFFVSMGLILWLWRKEVCTCPPFSLHLGYIQSLLRPIQPQLRLYSACIKTLFIKALFTPD
jgi:hypothetical protein